MLSPGTPGPWSKLGSNLEDSNTHDEMTVWVHEEK